MNFTDLLGTLAKAGMSPSAGERMRSSMGGGNGSLIDVLGGMLGGGRAGQGSQAGGMLGQMASRPLGRLHVCPFACLAACLPLSVAGSVGRGHGQLPPFRQDDQTQRRVIRHGSGGLSVGLRHCL